MITKKKYTQRCSCKGMAHFLKTFLFKHTCHIAMYLYLLWNILWKREHWLKIMTITQRDSWMGLTCIYCLDLGFRVTTSCMAAGMKLVFSCFKEMLLVTNLHVPCVGTLLHNFTPCASAQCKKLLYLNLFACVCVFEWIWHIAAFVLFVFCGLVWDKHEPSYFNLRC